jgi:predicted membrane channel-forming protein YqfA (hemolysin III family)
LEDLTMPLFVIALCVGFVARELRKPATTPLVFQKFWILGAAAGVQVVVVPLLTGKVRAAALFLTLGTAVVWLVFTIVRTKNKTLRWALLIVAAGTLMNIIPTLSYGAMPVDGAALRAAGSTHQLDRSAFGAKHVVVTGASVHFLGDRFPLRPLRCVASLGDFVEMFGIALLISVIPKRSRTLAVSPLAHGALTT